MADYADQPAPRRIRFDPTQRRGTEIYARAERHSRRVRWLKFILPGVAVAAVVGFFMTMKVISGSGEEIIALAGINVASKSLVMKTPHLSGFSGTQQSYELNAARAIQDLDNPKVVKLEEIGGHFGIGKGQTATIEAGAGVFDSVANTLVLSDGIRLTTTDGYVAELTNAFVDVTGGALKSDQPVMIHSTDGSIKANSVEVSNRGTHVVFSGAVSVSFVPPDDDNPPPASPASAEPADSQSLAKAAERLKSATE